MSTWNFWLDKGKQSCLPLQYERTITLGKHTIFRLVSLKMEGEPNQS